MDLVVLRRDAELLGAAPGDRPDVGFLLIVLFQNQPLGGVDLRHRIGDFEIEDCGRAFQPLGMLGALEHDAAIGAFALEHATRIMQAVGEYADLATGCGNELAGEPDEIGALVEGHCHGIASLIYSSPHPRLAAACARPAFASGRDSRYGLSRSIGAPFIAPRNVWPERRGPMSRSQL